MQLHISTKDGVPIYLQIVNQVKYLVAAGRLAPGEEIPPIRSLAEQLVVNPNTVAKAYHELEREGVVILTRRVDALLAEARHMDVPLKEILDLVHDRHDNLQPREEK